MRFQTLLTFVSLVASAVSAPSVVERTTKPLVESNKLRRVILRSELLAKAKTLEGFAYSTPQRNRVVGSPGHYATIDWIKETIEQFPDYYTVELQPFELPLAVSANLTAGGASIEVFGVTLSISGDVTGPLVHIPNFGCEAADFEGDLTGKITVIYRGSCQSAVKVGYSASAGAVGVLIYNNDVGNLDGYSLQRWSTPEGPYITTGGISQADGLALIARLDGGEEIIAHLSTEMRNSTTYNVIAQTIGGDQDNVIHLSGHSDSVAAGPGINDNGSGSISILEVAIQLTKFSVNNAVRFSWWSSEEEGLLGADYYVSQLSQEELDKIRLMLDFDMMASPNYVFQIYDGDGSAFGLSGPPGSAEAEAEFTSFFVNEAHENYTQIEFNGRSDYGPFLAAGVATGGIAAGADEVKTVEEQEMFGGVAGVDLDVNYHGPGDNVDNLNMGCWIVMTKAIAHMTATYARSFDSLPPKSEAARVRRMEAARMSEKAIGHLRGL